MKNSPLEWIKEAAEPTRTYRKMVVGWQNSVIALNATVRVFNTEYLKEAEAKDHDTHHLMREIAIKKLVISSLFELRSQLNAWYARLEKDGLLSARTSDKKKAVRQILKQIGKCEDIRNSAFHYGDVNDDTEKLIQLYEDVQSFDLGFLNRILEEMIGLGYMLRDDAGAKA